VRVRRFRDSDLAPFMAYRSDPEVARYQSWSPLSEPAARAFIAEVKAAPVGLPGEWIQLAIELKAVNLLIGDCALQVRADDKRQGELGFSLARGYQGQGLAHEAVTLLLDYIFTTLEMHRIVAQVDCRNDRSVALLERLGLRREGHCLQSYWLKGEWIDEYLYAILGSEWLAQPRGK